MFKTPLIAASAIGLAIISTPAIAEDGTKKAVTVEFKDLDLATPKGQKELDRRISRAANEVCEATQVLTGTRVRSPERVQCVREARAAVKQQVAAKIGSAEMGG